MTLENMEKLEERLSILEFKLELVLQLTNSNIDLSLENCKTMIEFAFVLDLKKDQFNAINELLSTQIKFYQTYKQQSYVSPRQYPKFEQDIDVFSALSKEEYETAIWKCIPKLHNNTQICQKIAKINGIQEMYYDQLATEIKKTKHERLDKETKLKETYKENKKEVANIYNDVNSLQLELKENLKKSDDIIEFFNKNELVKISLFYNGELWDRSNDDKRVVINEDTYIHNVCKTENNGVLDKISQILKDKSNQTRELIIYLLNSGPTSSRKIESLQAFYKELEVYNKKEYVQLDEIISLKEKLQSNLKIVDEILDSYNEYIKSI